MKTARLMSSRIPALAALLAVGVALTALTGCGKKEAGSGTAPVSAAPVPNAVTLEPVPGLQASAIETLPAIRVCSVENVAIHPALAPQSPVENLYRAPLGATVKFIGFATDQAKGQPLSNFTLLLVGEQVYGAAGQTGLDRPDVAAYFKKPTLAPSGYQLDGALSKLPAGRYTLWLRSAEGAICPTHQSLQIG